MTDTAMHFLACFSIVVVVFIIGFVFKYLVNMRGWMPSNEIKMYYYKQIITESVVYAITWSLVVGFGKEVVDIFRSDPQFKDLVADMAGAFTAGLLIWLIGTYYITRRFKSE